MKGYTLKGKLIYVDTDEGVVRIQPEGEEGTYKVKISDYVPKGPRGWVDFLGCDVECIVVDDKLTQLSEVIEE